MSIKSHEFLGPVPAEMFIQNPVAALTAFMGREISFQDALRLLSLLKLQVLTLDIDDCMVDTNGASENIAATFGETLDYSDFHYINRCTPACAQAISDFLFVGDASCDPKRVKLTSDLVPYYMKILSLLFTVYYVTARASDKFEPTIRYFEHYKIPISRNNLITLGSSADKLDVIIKLKSVFHMDDSATTILKCLEKNLNFCMISNRKTGYNMHLREAVGSRWANNIDELWQRRLEFIPMPQQGLIK